MNQEILSQLILNYFNKYHKKGNKILNAFLLETKLGLMLGVSDNEYLYYLKFFDQISIEHEVIQLSIKFNISINMLKNNQKTDIIKKIESQMLDYFSGKLKKFEIPIFYTGTNLQKLTWQKLQDIPYGSVITYLEQSKMVNKEGSYRAIGNVNNANKILIIIPCHRVISKTGKINGYSAGIKKKEWLLEHEKQYKN